MSEDIHIYPTRLAERRRKRLDKRRREALPLFATSEAVLQQVAPLGSVEDVRVDIQEMMDSCRQRIEAGKRRRTAEAAAMRWLVSVLVKPATLAILDKRRTIYPGDPVYAADFWSRMVRALPLMVCINGRYAR